MSLDFFAYSLHLIAAILWVGGMVFVGMVLAPLLRARLDSAQYASLMGEAGKRFMTIGWMCIATLVASGLLQAQGRPVISSTIFKIKIALAVLAILLSYIHDFVLGPRLAAGRNPSGARDAAALAGLRHRVVGLARFQLAVVILIVICAAMLRFHP